MNTTEIGDRFRDQITDLLLAAGYAATNEILEDHKRIDVLFEQTSFGKRRRYAVEAKNWKRALDRTDLERIFASYASFVTTRKIDELLVISPHELHSPAAKAFVRDTPGISHLSFKQFQESILGFQDYLSTFVQNHESEGLETYFIPPLLEDGNNLEKFISNWLDDASSDPIAILASYGMGKTSFAQHIAYKLARRFLSGEPCRVPVLVSLGAISREQSLEGLVGSVLAGRKPSVTNYNFPLFFHLNRIGRFLILLDGFDEMKHMMTWSEFQANFDELNRLVSGQAKVLLLGRPTVFLSENERAFVLRGVRTIGKTAIRAPGAPTYQQITLMPFSPPQIRKFMHEYLAHHQREGNIEADKDFLKRRKKEIDNKSHDSLISRPVHARMLADIATDPNVKISGISRFELYDHFVDHLILRELKKPGRGPLYKSNDWRSFACELAWYLWTELSTSGIGCRLDDLPDSLFDSYVPEGEDILTAKRTLLSGSFLDEKAGGVYFFSHRSFQEFLVAEFIWDMISQSGPTKKDNIDGIVSSLTREVFDFLIERDDRVFFRSFLAALNHCKSVTEGALAIIGSSRALREIASQRAAAFFSNWDAAILLASEFHGADKEETFASISRTILDKAAGKPMVILTAIQLLILLGIQNDYDVEQLSPTIVSLLFGRTEIDLANMDDETQPGSRGESLKDIIFETVSAQFDDDANLIMRLDTQELIDKISGVSTFPIWTGYLKSGHMERYEAPFPIFFSGFNKARLSILQRFYERDAEAAIAVKDELEMDPRRKGKWPKR